MTTLTSDLDLALKWARRMYPSTPSEIAGNMVHINYDFRQAVCIDVMYTEEGKVWYAGAASWHASGGVEEDIELVEGSLARVLDSVAVFLMQQAVQQEKLERLLDSRPED